VPSLYVIRGRDQGARFELESPVLTLGRDATNSVQVHDTEVSRTHAQLRRTGDSYTITDQKSSNGTFVNGRPVTEQVLVSGDQLQVGGTLMLYSGFSDESASELLDKIDIVSRRHADDGSRIVHSVRQKEGSALLLEADVEGADRPWLARARSNLQIMYRTALAVSHTLDIDELLSRIMEMIFEWVEADVGCVMLKQPETGELVPKVRRQRRGVRREEKLTISKTILDYVVDNNEGVLTSNAREDKRWDPAQSILQMGVREAICVPMQGRYGMVGVIYIDTSITPQQIIQQQGNVNKFTEEHLKLMIAIAHQAALAVEDTSYYRAMVQSERMVAVGQTIATLSHHIKNILQGIRSGSYLIEMGLEDHQKAADSENPSAAELAEAAGTIRKGWEFVERNQERITTLVMDMLTFSKDRDPEPVPSDLNAIVSDVVELMKSRADELGVKLEFKPAKQMPTMMFDPEGIHRSVLNVVTNAIDACRDCEAAHVTLQSEYNTAQEIVRVRVRDNGSGIEPADMEKIFTIFVSQKGGRGTGLGLSVSRKILEEHGGQILVESKVSQGSLFTLELPVVLPSDDSQADGRATHASAH